LRFQVLRRFSCNLIAPELVDESLQAGNALSIEILNFSQEHPLPSFTPSSAAEGFVHCVIRGESSPPDPRCVSAAFVDTADARLPRNPPRDRIAGAARLSSAHTSVGDMK
jgi:hypothetical protein